MPRNVKELLVEAKDASELIVDLAYAAVFFGDEEMAREVLRLEDRVDRAVHDLRVVCLLAARSPDDASALAGILGIGTAMEEITDAAEDVGRIVLRGDDVPGELREDLRHAEEVLARVKIREGSQLSGQSIGGVALASETGMWVIAVRREVDYLYGPSGDTVLHEGDVLFLQGSAEGVDLVRELAGGEARGLGPPVEQARLTHLDRAVDLLVELKNAAEVAVGLAYSALLFGDLGLVQEVAAVEDRCDQLYRELQSWVLRAAKDLSEDEHEELRSLLTLGNASERMADAAREMTRIVETEDEPHPVVAVALRETDEIVADALVAPGSAAEGNALRDLSLETETGMYVLAVQRGTRWTYRPRGTRTLAANDRVIATGPPEGVGMLRDILGDERLLEPAEA